MERRWQRHAALVLLAGIAFTAGIVAMLIHATGERDRAEFEANARAARDAVIERVDTSIALLRGTAGLFASQQDDVTVASFRAYMRRIALREHYPGILGIGFSRRIAPGERVAVVERMRRQGQPDFHIWPGGPSEELHAIVLLEPLDRRNQAAIGYDMFTHPVRRAAMERARDFGVASGSGVVELVQEIDEQKQPGFLIYLPVYRGGAMPATLEERRDRLLGFAYAPIRAGDFLSSAFSSETVPRVAFRVYHGSDPANGEPLYDHAFASAPQSARFTFQTTSDVAGQPWTFVFRSSSTALQSVAVPALIGAAGLALSFALATLVWREDRARSAIEASLEREQAARTLAERANRMKDEFLATLSHELRTPLNAMVGWAAVLRMGRLSEEDLHAGVEAIDRNAKAQARLIDDLLDMNRIVSGKLNVKLETIDPASAVDGALDSVLPAAQQKGVLVDKRVEHGVAHVRADAARLQQIIWNLLSNAIKFTPAGGHVRLALERTGCRVRIVVADNGEGIEPGFLAHVFDRFAQGDSSSIRRHAGLGIGLSIVRELVALHGGTVRAESEGRGNGATFVVELPLAEEGAASAQAPREQAMLDGIAVLVVDDEPDVRELLRLILGQRKARVRCADSAHEALELLHEFRPDVIVSDIGMPGMNGYELMRRIRALPASRGGDVPAAALTAYVRDADKREAIAAGFQRYLVKPVQPEVLASAVLALARRTDDQTSAESTVPAVRGD